MAGVYTYQAGQYIVSPAEPIAAADAYAGHISYVGIVGGLTCYIVVDDKGNQYIQTVPPQILGT